MSDERRRTGARSAALRPGPTPTGASRKISRRGLMAGAGGGMTAVASGLGAVASGCELGPIRDPASRALRIGHLTDIHVGPDGDAAEGMAAALRHVQGLADPPELLLNGGDCILDSLEADKARTAAQWEVWQRVLGAELWLPMAHCIGNHDVWGWGLDQPELEEDPLYGKAWPMQQLGLAERYYGFDRGGWRFLVLDSTARAPAGGYLARLDESQWQWLDAELHDTPSSTPICLLSHVPLFCACAFFDGANEQSGDWQVPGAWMHIDARRIKDRLAQQQNVRLCLSGHSHLQDRVEYLGVSYHCNGAVSGGWWQGPYQEFGSAYAIIDLYPDGGFDAEMVDLENRGPS